MTKLVEATNGYSLVEVENDIWYDIVEATVDAVAFFIERRFSMARRSRKHQHAELSIPPVADVVGYIRLSVVNREEVSSIQNQKFIIECWGNRIDPMKNRVSWDYPKDCVNLQADVR